MVSLKLEIAKVLQNEKMADFFANSDGQGMLPTDCDKIFTFRELLDLKETILSSSVQAFISENEDLPNLQNFFKFLRKRVNIITNIYIESNTPDYIINNVIKPNQKAILNKFPTLSRTEALTTFAALYQSKHKELIDNTYDQVKDFFDNPVAWI